MNKGYVLMTIERSKYDDYFKCHYTYFENYYELQKHLNEFWNINKNDYIVFEETNIQKDYSTNIRKGK